MKIAISGLGRMGGQIAKKLHDDGHDVVAHNRSAGKVDEARAWGATAAYDKQSVVDAFADQPVVLWIMVPADVIESELDEWLEILPSGSVIIDGGNSDYRGDQARADKVSARGSRLLDIGTSGGVWGLENGFSMMVGGDPQSYQTVVPALETLAAPRGGHQFFGAVGSGHYVKMVHNAIEYGMMQSFAEGYRMLKEGPYKEIDLAAAGDIWQQSSVVTSWLNDLTRQALHENPTMEGISGVVAESGEARWTLETADELGIPMPAIQAAFDVRLASQQGDVDFSTQLLAAMRAKFGGHDINGK
ncbi:NADP-dependent phosphogluconate dehydrogenase [Candidatus Saccharibacteria bacterium]|nr:NADP-dependent phosphogluconate dehydrogenase [Candidatus Saccharibacteria bacterium]MBH1972772.1 NADP-dependent phosphogluconate dehydrogenase [Candidatus Saccharibacteria bacterium]MBH1990973.1 NADP-dependent phosphogluconate dehydrogenase [Candidatus Saccharibacteria bacterium]